MEKATVVNRIIKTELVDWKSLKFIQQDGFKQIADIDLGRLKKSIINNQFAQPFFVTVLDNEIYCLDGKHRTIALQELINEGYDIPDLFPANFLKCDTYNEAAKLVLIFSSMYAKVSADGFKEFSELYDFEIKDLFDEISIPEFEPDLVLDFPEDLTALPKNKPAVIRLTFQTPKELEQAQIIIERELREKFPDMILSVSAGEI